MAAEADGGSEFPAHYKVMMDKLNEQRQLDQFTDITLIVDGHQFRAHKAVLAACSQFFHKFFQDFTQEPLVEIEGVSNMAFRQLMEFTYTATLAVAGEEEAYDVWKAAEYLQMQEAIKALNNKINENPSVTTKNQGKKRKIAETSNVITETLPSVDGEQVEIEVIGEGAIEVEESGLEEVVDAAKNAQAASDDSALALLADITSKYQQGEPALQVIKKGGIEEQEVVYQEETVTASKVLENVEVVEVQISQVDNVFRCTKCDRSFKLYYHLKQHLKTHLGMLEKPHVCNHCGKAYTREGALKQHISTFHFDAEELSRNQKPQKKVHVCEYCKKHFDHFGHFKEHLRKHTGEKPYECPDCHERFARNSTLKCHMAACQNGAGAKKGRKKLYECQVCSSVFNSWDQFKDHLVSHTGVKPNHCTMCDLWFTHTKDLKAHLKDVHSIEELVITDSPATAALTIATQNIEGAETVLLDDGIQVEHVTVEPVDVMEMGETTTVVVEDGGVAEMCEEDVERLKQAGLQIQVVHVTTTEVDGQQVVNSQVEVEMEGGTVNVEEAEQAVAV
ncbi:zinc finger protein 131 isoform X1 [Thunnus albacares]|uniref:zinc finger protein 131 isoform X1 n=1 Tax=Thunnus maccoyii TaxID=8240 RepID=UPI001C4DC760|nr:zinc finger protein 131 isoform X1 [Thunnus maccoyii]XP_042278454.1 zinc finger protein 131 isoform X1 [Thunnus maccoyii]XP_042278455.1 zinc finger protein 131 isoform X1 [Thunnus maccoyii]XP_044230552.1 zinc finger protein 131 isoform X1 [Thunnus albacares]XP_044230561.1 zinc finger protein 131 isoform X1 [Thunnus albacares]XP_044230571.1 zinc finger protein 131 isoform X1 [Thunnus albacares]